MLYVTNLEGNHFLIKTFSIQLSPTWHHFLTIAKRKRHFSSFVILARSHLLPMFQKIVCRQKLSPFNFLLNAITFSQIEKVSFNFFIFDFSAMLVMINLEVNNFQIKTFQMQLSPMWHHFLTIARRKQHFSYLSFQRVVIYYQCSRKSFVDKNFLHSNFLLNARTSSQIEKVSFNFFIFDFSAMLVMINLDVKYISKNFLHATFSCVPPLSHNSQEKIPSFYFSFQRVVTYYH